MVYVSYSDFLDEQQKASGGSYPKMVDLCFPEKEPEVQKVLGLPDRFAVAAMVPLGVPVKQLTKLSRKPVEEFVTVDSFDGQPFTIGATP